MLDKIVLNITSIIWSLVFLSSNDSLMFKSAQFLASAVSRRWIASAATTYFDMLRDFGFWLTSITMHVEMLTLLAADYILICCISTVKLMIFFQLR